MISTYQRLKRRRDAGEINGFTLIELLIVIVVLGILAAVVIFALGGITGKSQLAACQADGATVSTAMSAFTAQNPGVPITSTLLTGTTDGGPYIQSWPSATSYSFYLESGALFVKAGPAANPIVTTGAIAYFGPAACGPATASTTSIGLH